MDGIMEGYAAYESWEAQQPKQQAITAEQGQKRIAFSQSAYKIAHFGLLASGTATAVLIFRMLPWLSFGSFALRVIAIAIVGREAIFGTDEERPGYQAATVAIMIGSTAGEWDAILAIIGAVADFLTMYGGSIGLGLVMVAILAVWVLGGRHVQQA